MKRLQKTANNDIVDKFFNVAKKEIVVSGNDPQHLSHETEGKEGHEYFGIEFSIGSSDFETIFADVPLNKIEEILDSEYAKQKAIKLGLELIEKPNSKPDALEHTVDIIDDTVTIYIGLDFPS